MFHLLSLFVSLCLFRLLLSGLFTPFLLAAGAGSAAVVWFVAFVLVRAALGPTLFHRVLAANSIGTVAMLLAAMGFLGGRPEFPNRSHAPTPLTAGFT